MAFYQRDSGQPGLREGVRFLLGEPPQLRDLNRQFPKTKAPPGANGVLDQFDRDIRWRPLQAAIESIPE